MYSFKISVLTLKQIEQLAKIIKSDFISIDSLGRVYGCSNNVSVFFKLNQTFKVTTEDHTVVPVIFNVLDLKNFLKTKALTDMVTVYVRTGDFDIAKDGLESHMYLNLAFNQAFGLINVINRSHIEKFYHLEENEHFMEAVNRPSPKGGLMIPFSKNYQITIHKGMLPINKGDLIGLECIPLPDNNRFIAQFTISKKKGIVIDEYMVCLKLS